MNATHSKRDAAFTNAETNIFETNIIETFCEKWLENEFEDEDLIEEDDDLFDEEDNFDEELGIDDEEIDGVDDKGEEEEHEVKINNNKDDDVKCLIRHKCDDTSKMEKSMKNIIELDYGIEQPE